VPTESYWPEWRGEKKKYWPDMKANDACITSITGVFHSFAG
jgi:hypothetical protein